MKQNETPGDVPDAVPPVVENGSAAGDGNASAKPPARSGGKPPLSRERLQQARRKWLRTILLTGGVTGAALSGFLPLVYARTKRLRPRRRAHADHDGACHRATRRTAEHAVEPRP